MNKKIKTAIIAATIASTSFSAMSQDTGADWGNPYDLYIGSVMYSGSGMSGHSGNHGSVVTGPSFSVCNDRINQKKAMHTSAGDSQTSEVMCYLKTTVLYQPQKLDPDSDNGSNPDLPFFDNLEQLEVQYSISLYQEKLEA